MFRRSPGGRGETPNWAHWIVSLSITIATTFCIFGEIHDRTIGHIGLTDLWSILKTSGLAIVGAGIGVFITRLGLSRVQSGRRFRLAGIAYFLSMLYAYLAVLSMLNMAVGVRDNSISPSTVAHDFWTSGYFTLMTVTTVGYGDCTPNGAAGRAIACITAVSGYLILALLVGIVSYPGARSGGGQPDA